ncbi:hypothetical protein HKCCE4037_07005 [Rhodobacterales bacterium HKCCE4037]|nr:hypothetical protein [Rhodobacterales bacterium HKCCE4037]
MKPVGWIVAAVAVVAIVLGVTYMVDIDQTEEGSLPEVSVEGGNLPEFDADVGEIEVGTTEEEVTVPEVEIDTREATVTVPDIDVTPPEEETATQ